MLVTNFKMKTIHVKREDFIDTTVSMSEINMRRYLDSHRDKHIIIDFPRIFGDYPSMHNICCINVILEFIRDNPGVKISLIGNGKIKGIYKEFRDTFMKC